MMLKKRFFTRPPMLRAQSFVFGNVQLEGHVMFRCKTTGRTAGANARRTKADKPGEWLRRQRAVTCPSNLSSAAGLCGDSRNSRKKPQICQSRCCGIGDSLRGEWHPTRRIRISAKAIGVGSRRSLGKQAISLSWRERRTGNASEKRARLEVLHRNQSICLRRGSALHVTRSDRGAWVEILH